MHIDNAITEIHGAFIDNLISFVVTAWSYRPMPQEMLASQSQDKIEQFDPQNIQNVPCPTLPDFCSLLLDHIFFESNITSVVCVCIAISHVNPCNVRSKDSESQSGASQESQVSSLRTSELSNIWRYLETSAEDY